MFTLLLFMYFVYVCHCRVVVACLFLYPLFYTALLLLPVYFFIPFFILMLLLCIIGYYNPLVRIIDLGSHTTYIVCVNLIHKLRDLQFKVDSERKIFWKTFDVNFIYSQSFYPKSAERKSPKKYSLYFVLMSGLGLESWPYI